MIFDRTEIASLKKAMPGRISLFFSMTFALFMLTNFCEASPASVSAKADTTQIRIGEQFHVDLTATIGSGTQVIFPFLADTFNHFEIVKRSEIDTVKSKGNNDLTLHQLLTLTSFDSGYFVIPPMSFVLKKGPAQTDSLQTEAMLMTVTTIPVDTTKEIRNIKDVIGVAFPWKDYLIYLIIAVLMVPLIIYLIRKFGKSDVKVQRRKVPDRPAHEIALTALKKLEEEQLWQQGYIKKYHSALSDILRQYIERRFTINAMEQTTEEILGHLGDNLIPQDDKGRLRFTLRLADMVKFAKAQPLPEDNEIILQYAIDFVNNTKPVTKEEVEKAEVKV